MEKKKKNQKNLFFLGLNFEWNLSVSTVRSGTDYCWLYCGENDEMQIEFREKMGCKQLVIFKFVPTFWESGASKNQD